MHTSYEATGFEHVDGILVLGRGIEADGTLSKLSAERTIVAMELANQLLPKVVVFSGGRSWRQVAEGVSPPSEGGAMLQYAHEVAGGSLPVGVEFLAEEESESTVANMVNSRDLLGLAAGMSLGLLSDKLHFLYGRPELIAGKVFADVAIRPFMIPVAYTPEQAREEWLSTFATRVALAGVRRGNVDSIMARQRGLERFNGMLRGKAA